jgi:hypothetical protein
MSDHTHITTVSVEDAFIADWAAEGLAAIERHLANHAAFAEYLRARSDRAVDGDRADTD